MNIIKRNGSEAVFEKAKILVRALAGGFAVASQPSLARPLATASRLGRLPSDNPTPSARANLARRISVGSCFAVSE